VKNEMSKKKKIKDKCGVVARFQSFYRLV